MLSFASFKNDFLLWITLLLTFVNKFLSFLCKRFIFLFVIFRIDELVNMFRGQTQLTYKPPLLHYKGENLKRQSSHTNPTIAYI